MYAQLKKLLLFAALAFWSGVSHAQVTAGDCADAINICTNASFSVSPNGYGNIDELAGNTISNPSTNPNCCNSGCLLAGELNSTWMIINIATTGNLEFSMGTAGSGYCFDWIMWDYDPNTTCNDIMNNSLPPVMCNWNGMCGGITGAASAANITAVGGDPLDFEAPLPVTCGDQYLICFSNYSSATTSVPLNFFGSATVDCQTFTPITVNDTTICENECATLTANGGNSYSWDPDPALSSTSGSTVTACPTGSGTFDYYVTGTGNCGTGTDTATVTVLPLSNSNCSTPCNMDSLFVNIGLCDPNTDTYPLTGDLYFSGAPATGQLIIEDCWGNQDVYNAPFTSPVNWSISGLPSDGGSCSVTAYFTDDPACTISLNYTAPPSCACGAVAGTYTAGINGNATNNYVLCVGDEFTLTSNGDNTDPPDVNDPTITYDPGIWFLVYDCPPTVGPPNDVNTDPCLLGVAGTTNGSFSVTNTNGTPDTLYYVPITMYSMVDGYYSASNSSQLCYALGPVYEVVFLPDITYTATEDCQDSTVTVTVSGGYAQVAGGNFTASNLSPASAYFVNNTTTNGGNIVVGGLVDGDNYSFDVVDDNGCPVTVTGGPFVGLDVVNVDPAGPFCDIDPTYNMTATPGGGAWTATCGACITSTGTFDPGAAGAGSYTIYYTSPGYCGNVDSTTVSVNSQFDATIDPAGPFCESDPVYTMTPTVDPGGTWSATCGACIDGPTGDFDPFVAGAGTHTITYAIGGACGDTNTTSVIVNPDQDASINNPGGPFCLGYGIVTVTAVNGGGTWSATCGACIDANTGDFDPAAAGIGTHTITYTLPNPCGDTQTVDIEVVDNFDATITQVGPFCEDDGQVQLNAVDGGGNWSATCGGCVDAQGNFDPAIAGAGTHTITYDIPGNCGDTQTIDIIVNAVPTMNFTVDSASGCIPVTATFIDNSTPNGVDCQWDFGDGTTSTDCDSATHTYSQPGCYDVSLTITTADGCSNSETVTDMVCTYAYADAEFTFAPTDASVMDPEIFFNNQSTNADSYIWDFNGEGTSTAENPSYEFSNTTPGTYVVCLMANNANNCPDSTCQTVIIRDDFVLYAPNAFTPDGDGINDTWQPIVRGHQPETYKLMIFDRWGQLIFETEHPNVAWDGSVKGIQSNAKTDTYVWKVEVEDQFNKTYEFYGHVTLLK